VTVTINDKTILKRVSGMAKAGEILAIMGPSGTFKEGWHLTFKLE